MFMCDVTKTPRYARNFVNSECSPYVNLQIVTFSFRFNGKNDNVVLEYCINSAQTKNKMTMHYILQHRHIFIRVKAFILMLIPGGVQLPIISTCFVWRPVTSINKCGVLTARAHANCHINTWLFCSLIYAF